MNPNRYSLDFGKKERVLNYTSNAYQLTRPTKVGQVMALIRECQPKSFDEWEQWYFKHAYTATKTPIKMTKDVLNELGERLYEKITQFVIPEWQEAFRKLILQDCIDYIYNLTINRTYDGFIREKSVINDNLVKIFPSVNFVESNPELDHAGDIDYLGWVGEKAFGIQIKPITANANFGNYSISDRMRCSFEDFEQKYGGRVFIIFSIDDKITNEEVISEIRQEIQKLKSQ